MGYVSKENKIFIAGHKGMVGSALLRALKKKGEKNFLLKSSEELDLTNQKEVNSLSKEITTELRTKIKKISNN